MAEGARIERAGRKQKVRKEATDKQDRETRTVQKSSINRIVTTTKLVMKPELNRPHTMYTTTDATCAANVIRTADNKRQEVWQRQRTAEGEWRADAHLEQQGKCDNPRVAIRDLLVRHVGRWGA